MEEEKDTACIKVDECLAKRDPEAIIGFIQRELSRMIFDAFDERLLNSGIAIKVKKCKKRRNDG